MNLRHLSSMLRALAASDLAALLLDELIARRRLLIWVLGLSLLAQLTTLVFPVMIRDLVDSAAIRAGEAGSSGLILIIALLIGIEAFLNFVRSFKLTDLLIAAMIRLYDKLFLTVLNLPLENIGRVGAGSVSQCFGELERSRDTLLPSILAILTDIPFLLISLLLISWFSPLAALLVLVVGTVFVASSALVQPAVRRALKVQLDERAREEDHLIFTLTNLHYIRALNIEKAASRIWAERTRSAARQGRRVAFLFNVTIQVSSGLERLATVALLAVCGTLVSRGDLTLGDLVAINILGQFCFGPMRRVVYHAETILQSAVSLARIQEIIEPAKGPAPDADLTVPPLGPVTELRVEELHLDRPDFGGSALLIGTMVFEPGGVTALAGRSGAGKSSILDSLAGLRNDVRMILRTNGGPIDVTTFRRSVAYCPQVLAPIPGSLAESFALLGVPETGALTGAPPALRTSYGELWQHLVGGIVSRGRDFSDFAAVATRDLSAGQIRLVNLLAVLASDRPILLLDEPTEGLDLPSRRILARVLAALPPERLVIAASHDPDFLGLCSKTYHIRNGRLAAPGSARQTA